MMLGAILLVVALFLVVPGDGDFRRAGVPWVASASMGLLLWGILSIQERHAGRPSRLLKTGFELTVLGLIGPAVLFVGLGVAGLFSLEPQLQQSDLLQTGVAGVLVAAGAGAVALPLGLIFYGAATFKERVLPSWNSGLLAALGLVYVAGFVAVGMISGTAQLLVATVWLVLFSSGWLVLGFSLAAEADAPGSATAKE